MKGFRLYTTLFPCNECAKAIIQKGIAEVIYLSDKYSDAEMTKAAKMMFKSAGVKCREYEQTMKSAELKL